MTIHPTLATASPPATDPAADGIPPLPILHDPLWPRLAAFVFDVPGAALPFTRRLARDQGWSPAYAARVLDEYRRFVYLCLRAGHPCTPSVDVDEAWHLHLTYTESYWVALCAETLGRPLHHGPTRGGRDETARYGDLYELTLASYARIFGSAPPSDVWPRAAVRMDPAHRPRVVRPATHWVFAKPAWLRPSRPVPGVTRRALLAAVAAALLAPAALSAADGSAHGGVGLLIAVAALVALAAVLLLDVRRTRGHAPSAAARRRRGTADARRADGGESGITAAGTSRSCDGDGGGEAGDAGGGCSGCGGCS